MTAEPPPIEVSTLVCDRPDCDAESIGSALVRHPYDADASEQARRGARKDAITRAIAEGWTVAIAGAKTGDWCPRCAKESR